MANISDIFYGVNITNLILGDTWSPSTGQYPDNTNEGFMFIAEDDGTVSGIDYTSGDTIIYNL